MYKKESIILLLLFLVTACSTVKDSVPTGRDNTELDAVRTVQKVASRNLTNTGFFIQKGKITTSGEAGRINLLFTMKYVKPGNYLISLRSITGMEAFRIFISGDTVLINDRLNEQLLYGTPYDFERITGIHPDLLRVSLGDFIENSSRTSGNGSCVQNELKVESYYKGLLVNSIIDCRLEKVKSVLLASGLPDEKISIIYSKHRFDYFKVPRRIEVNDSRRKVKITIKIEKYISPWIGEIEFIPGAGYLRKSLI